MFVKRLMPQDKNDQVSSLKIIAYTIQTALQRVPIDVDHILASNASRGEYFSELVDIPSVKMFLFWALQAAYEYLVKKQQTHSKVKNIKYEKLETQNYLKSPLFSNNESSLLYSLRSRSNETFKANFRNKYGNVVLCPRKCWVEGEPTHEDTQCHIL